VTGVFSRKTQPKGDPLGVAAMVVYVPDSPVRRPTPPDPQAFQRTLDLIEAGARQEAELEWTKVQIQVDDRRAITEAAQRALVQFCNGGGETSRQDQLKHDTLKVGLVLSVASMPMARSRGLLLCRPFRALS
jgi:hypothetical protein